MTPGGARPRSDAPLVAAAALALLVLAGYVLVVAAGPLITDDLWWHLAIGEVYAHEGPWPDGDPLLHTAHADAPVQQEWLFGVLTFAIDRVAGFHGLRAAHALAVVALLAFVFALCRRAAGSVPAACFGGSLFVVLSWFRLVQLRADLVSIPLTLATFTLLLEREEPPSWRRVALFGALCALWANLHALFAVGPLLVGAALAALLFRALLRRRLPEPERAAAGGEGARARRLAAALGLGLVASAANPRGFAQHLTFLTASREHGIWQIHDDWTPFDPFAFDYTTAAVSRLAWLATDALLVAFALTALIVLARFLRRPSRERLEACQSVLLALGCAGVVALLVSIRFLWLGLFPLLYVLHALRPWLADGAAPTTVRGRLALRVACAAACVALAVGFPIWTPWREMRALQPSDARRWLATPFVAEKYHVEGVRFLRDAGLEGNLFNKYPMGGFLEYWVGPRLRVFVDGRTEHYPIEVLEEYSAVNLARGTRPGEDFLELLERRQVDIFFGTGPPTGIWRDAVLYTAEHLRDAPGWLLIQRSADHAIYLRTNPRNRENLARVVAWYAREGVPFDPDRGLDAARVVDERPDWAQAHGLLPRDWDAVRAGAVAGDFAALDALARTFALLGLYERSQALDAHAISRRPEAKSPRRREIYALLRLGNGDEALAHARALVALDPSDPFSIAALRVANRHTARARQTTPDADGRPVSAPDAPLALFPLLDAEERAWLAHDFARTGLP